jgi:hypothetical protein
MELSVNITAFFKNNVTPIVLSLAKSWWDCKFLKNFSSLIMPDG